MSDFTADTGEGRIYQQNAVWATCRGAAAGVGTDGGVRIQSALDGGNYNINRSFLPFDTSTLPDGAIITSATLKLYRDDTGVTYDDDDSTSIEIVTQTQADETTLGTGDYDQVAFASKGTANFSATSNGAYISIAITDLSVVSKTGYTKLAIITGRDLNNSAPTALNQVGFQDNGDANPPTLTIEYTFGGNPMFFSSGGVTVG